MNPGDRVLIDPNTNHLYAGHRGTLVAYEKYDLGWYGWRVKLDGGRECFCSPVQLRNINPQSPKDT